MSDAKIVRVKARQLGQIKLTNKHKKHGFQTFWKEPGDIFHIPEDKLAPWMEVLPEDAPEPEPAEVVTPGETLSEAQDPLARIRGALEKLDPNNDEHWTKAGDPAMAAIEEILGDTSVTRDEVSAADPGFNRTLAAERV